MLAEINYWQKCFSFETDEQGLSEVQSENNDSDNIQNFWTKVSQRMMGTITFNNSNTA